MERRKKILIGKTVALLSVIPLLLYGHAAGPDPAKSGVPGEGNCAEAGCHVGTPLNGGGGSVKIVLQGNTYTPGVKQHVTIQISDAAEKRWGFQFTARLAGNSKTQAGTLTPGSDGFTQLVCAAANLLEVPCNASSPLVYIEHTIAGTRLGITGGVSFDFDWTPPSTNAGNITLYVAANAANGNLLETGDHIYTTNLTVTPAAAGGDKPIISGVVNGASFQPGITQNGWVTISGTNLAKNTRIWGSADFDGNKLPTQLDGTSATINGQAAFVYFISPAQVNVLAPVDASLGPVQVTLSNNGQTSDPATAQMQGDSPAFFIFKNNYIASTHADGSFLGPPNLFDGVTTTPAKPGETIILYGTGFGQTNPAIPNGQIVTSASPLVTQPVISIGGTTAQIQFGGQSATGLYQFNVVVPASTQNGDVAVVATIGGFSSPSTAIINVQK